MSRALVLRAVELNGARIDVRVEDGVIAAIGDVSMQGADIIDANGGALIPGLIDHHIHLFATAARLASIDLSDARDKSALLMALRQASAKTAAADWLRAIKYDDTDIGLLSRDDLDQVGAPNPMRVQDRTGALWVLNSAALARVLDDAPPPCVERDASGRPTGRIWRGDAWLRGRMKSTPPSLAPLSRQLAGYGIVGLTDTSVTNGADEARLFAQARRRGELLQSLCLMSGDDMPEAADYAIGSVKILPDERDLPELSDMVERMRRARQLNRAIAVHCVTAAELVLALAAFEAIGARDGDRLEHGGIIPAALIENIRALGLTVVTQPNFIRDRGDRYTRSIEAADLPDLYRLASLRKAGVRIAAGSDAPYGDFNPWSAIAAATDRKTKGGVVIGGDERLEARAALGLYLTSFGAPGGAERKIALGEPADLCVLDAALSHALAAPGDVRVQATLARGELIFTA